VRNAGIELIVVDPSHLGEALGYPSSFECSWLACFAIDLACEDPLGSEESDPEREPTALEAEQEVAANKKYMHKLLEATEIRLTTSVDLERSRLGGGTSGITE